MALTAAMIDQAARKSRAVRRKARFFRTLQVPAGAAADAVIRSRPRVTHRVISSGGNAMTAITAPASRHEPPSAWTISGIPTPARIPPTIDQPMRAPLSRVRSS